MKPRQIDEVRKTASVYPGAVAAPMTRRERLERWAQLLERHPGRMQMLHQLELASEPDRDAMRQDKSPIAIAFADPVLRLQGLAGDTYQDARQFFDLTAAEAHLLLCDCHVGAMVSGRAAASRVRSIAAGTERSLAFVGVLGATALAAAALIGAF
jgi:hypothetical protein